MEDGREYGVVQKATVNPELFGSGYRERTHATTRCGWSRGSSFPLSVKILQQCIFLKSGSWKKWGRERNVNVLWRVDQSLLCCNFDSGPNSEAFVLRPNAEALFLFAWPSPLSSSSCGLAGSGWEGLVSICKCN